MPAYLMRKEASVRASAQRLTRGFFVTLEGGDGCGKSTHAAKLAQWLQRRGSVVRLTREPGGTRLGELMRPALLRSGRMAPWTEALLFQALRVQHVAEVIRPALARGQVVICDRFADSTMAYQGYGLGLDRTVIAQITRLVTQKSIPDLTIILDAPPATGLRRARRRQRMEQRGVRYQQHVRAGFLAIARQDRRRCRVIRVQPTIAATQVLIRHTVMDALQRRLRP